MGKQETVLTPQVRGAGRSMDIFFQGNGRTTFGNSPDLSQTISRQNLANPAAESWAESSGGLVTAHGWTEYRGRIAYIRTNGVSPSTWALINDSSQGHQFPFSFPTSKGDGNFGDDFSCWEVGAIAAFSGGVDADLGLEAGPQGFACNILTSTNPGFLFAPVSATSVHVKVRQVTGGPLTVDRVVVPVTDVTDWHRYGIRFIGATATVDAIVRFMFDGLPVASFSYGAGTLLPDLGGVTAFSGMSFGLCNRVPNLTSYLALCGFTMWAAPNEASLP